VVIISAENKPAQNNFYLTKPFDITVWAGIVSNTDGKVFISSGLVAGFWRVDVAGNPRFGSKK